MTALLEVPAIRERAMRFSVEAYHRFTAGQSTELLRGIILEKISKSPIHRFVADELREIISAQVEPEFTVFHEGPLTLEDSEPEPDVAVVRGSRSNFREKHPSTAELVIEVAVSSIEVDRVKAGIYAEAGVREYWIVCPEEKCVEVFREPGAQGYAQTQTVSAPSVLECSALTGLQVDLAALFS
jgi:Uma2 family endonuclease